MTDGASDIEGFKDHIEPTVRWALQGLFLLIMGIMIYVLLRPKGTSSLLPDIFVLELSIPQGVRSITDVLPALLHTAGFSLLTCALVSNPRTNAILICTSWALINCIIEIGQIPFVAQSITILLGENQLPFVTAYFMRGNFDLLDLLASCVGAVLAWYFVYHTWRLQ